MSAPWFLLVKSLLLHPGIHPKAFPNAAALRVHLVEKVVWTGLSDQRCGLQSRRVYSPEGLSREGAEEYILRSLLQSSDLLLVALLAK